MNKPLVSEKIAIASDHAGFALKEKVKGWLADKGFEVLDLGTHSQDSCDYPDFAHRLAQSLEEGVVSRGVGVCGTGEGMAITLNRHPKVRAALVWDREIATMTRLHNDANVLVLPGRFISDDEAQACLDNFLHTAFEGGRHERRIAKMAIPV